MRNIIQPTLVELGTITRASGQEYHVQRLRYGTHHSVYIFRKGELNKRGTVFHTEAEFEQWKAHVRAKQFGLFE